MSRVDLIFAGNARSAVSAARETAGAIKQLRGEARGATDDLGKTTRGAIAGSGAFRGLGRSIAFASAGFLGGFGLAAAVRGAVDELSNSIKVNAQTQAALKSTGGVANVTAREIDDLSKSLLRKSGVDDEVIKTGQNMLLTFTNIRNEVGAGNDIYNQASKAVLDMDVAMTHGNVTAESMAKTSILVGKALQDPILGLTSLRRVGVAFTDQQKEQIKVMVDSGQTLQAQKFILRELNKEFGGSAEAMGRTLPGQISILRESVKNLSADVLRGLTPAILSGVKAGQEWVDKLQASGDAQRIAKRVGQDLAEIVRDGAAAARIAAKGFGVMSDAVGGDADALKLLGGAALGWKLTGAVNAVTGMVAVRKAAEAAAGAEGAAAAGGIAGRSGLALLLARLKLLGTIGVITVGIKLVLDAHTTKTGLHRYSGLGGWANLAHDLTGGLIPESGAGGGTESTLKGGSGGALGSLLSGAGSTTLKPSAGAPPTSFANRVSGPTGGLTTLQGALPGAKGDPSMGYSGHAAKSYHYSGEALDIGDGGNPASLISDWNFLYPHRHQLAELIWNPPAAVRAQAPGSGAGYFWGVPGGFSDHTDHIHVAFTGTASEASKIFQGKVLAKINTPGGGKDNTWSKGVIGQTMTRLDTAVSRAKALTPKNVSDDLAALNAERDYVKQVIAHTGGTKALYDQLDQLNNEIEGLTTSKTKKAKSGLSILSAGTRSALADARGTKGLDDDLRALRAARAELEKKPQTVPVKEELANINQQINAIDDKKAAAKLSAIAKAHADLAKKVKAAIDAQKAAWDQHIQHLKTVADQARTEFEDKWATAANAVLRAFDKATAAGLAALGAPKQTAEEKTLADFLAGRGADQLARTRAGEDAQFQTDLAAASSPEEVAKIQADRAEQIRQRELDDQQTALEDAAQQSRVAADQAASDAQAAYQEQRDLQRDELQKWLNEQEQKLEDGRVQWGTFFADLQAMALAGGWSVGTQFWAAWDAANAAHAGDASAAGALGVATTASAVVPFLEGDMAIQTAYLASLQKKLPGYAGGGWAGSQPRSMDPRDTILAKLRDGEYVMSPEEVAAGRPNWARGGGGGGDTYLTGDIYLEGQKVGKAVAVHVTNAQERQIGYQSPRG